MQTTYMELYIEVLYVCMFELYTFLHYNIWYLYHVGFTTLPYVNPL